MESIKNETTWNKKRIFLTLFLAAFLVAGGFFLKANFLEGKQLSVQNVLKSVKGTSVEEKSKEQKGSLNVNVKKALEDKINSLKQDVSGLNILEIASSSPQVQKILNDIKSLEQYPETQAKEICKKICGL